MAEVETEVTDAEYQEFIKVIREGAVAEMTKEGILITMLIPWGRVSSQLGPNDAQE